MGRMIVKGGTIVNADGTVQADLIVEGEQIAGIVKDAQPGPDDRVIDAAGKLVLPGVVDAHTHIQLDTGIYKTADNWLIGTKAAAAGGVTTVIDFANQIRGKPFAEGLEARMREAADAIIDYSFHFVVVEPARDDEQLKADLQGLLDLGIPSIKLFTTYRPNYYLDDAALLHIFRAMPREMIAMVHCENDSIVTDATQRLVEQGKVGWSYHSQSRPEEAEIEAIRRILTLADFFPFEPPIIYIAHCSTSDALSDIREHKKEWSNVYCETCPQYLMLDESAYQGEKPEHFILQPPLRDWGSVESLKWQVREGIVDVISTDSCDYTLAQKQAHSDFTKTPGGLPGLETLLPLIYTLFCDEQVHKIIGLMTANPARIFGLYPQKGTLQVGSDADIVLYDPEPEWTLSHTDLHYVAGYSPYEGMRIKGRVALTISRGEIVYEYGKPDPFEGVRPGRGRFVPGKPFDPSLVL